MELLSELKKDNTLILWTSKNKRSVSNLKKTNKDLFSMFDEIYCKEDHELLQDIPGCSVHEFKDIKKINADCMIESKQNYVKYIANLHMSDKYCIVSSYRNFMYDHPAKWKIKMLGEEVIEKWQERVKKKDEWIYSVLEFVDKLQKKDEPIPTSNPNID